MKRPVTLASRNPRWPSDESAADVDDVFVGVDGGVTGSKFVDPEPDEVR